MPRPSTWAFTVDLLMAYSKRLDLLFDLVSAVERLRGSDAGEFDGPRSVRSGHTPRVWRVGDRLDGTDVQHLISCYRDGVTVRELAEQFKIIMTSVKRLLQEHRARRKDASVDPVVPGSKSHNPSPAARLPRALLEPL